jgi:hypothetical protein
MRLASVKISPEWITGPEQGKSRRTAGYAWTDYKTNTKIAKELKIAPVLDKFL